VQIVSGAKGKEEVRDETVKPGLAKMELKKNQTCSIAAMNGPDMKRSHYSFKKDEGRTDRLQIHTIIGCNNDSSV